jgi:hypothetical protein
MAKSKNPSPPSLMERIRGKRTKDIRLPQEVDTQRDPRLPAASPLESIRENIERTRDALRPKKMSSKRARKRGATRRA